MKPFILKFLKTLYQRQLENTLHLVTSQSMTTWLNRQVVIYKLCGEAAGSCLGASQVSCFAGFSRPP